MILREFLSAPATFRKLPYRVTMSRYPCHAINSCPWGLPCFTFPIWKRDTTELAHAFIDRGFKAVITCVDTDVLDREFAGREFDERLLSDLPAGVDPCGENGEFHTFAYAGPMFSEQILIEKGEVVLRDNRFCFCDFMPG